MECKYFEIGNLYCSLEYAMLYWNQIPISPDIWSRSVYRQKFVKNRLSDTHYHERLIKIAMSCPAKNFFCPVMMLWEKPCNLRVFIRLHSLWFPSWISLKFEFCIYFFSLQMAPLHFIKYIWLTHTMHIWSVVFYSSRLISRKILFIHL